jgi:Fe-Mn family superoxide dismutase
MTDTRRAFLKRFGVAGAAVAGLLETRLRGVEAAPAPAAAGGELAAKPFKEALGQTEGISLKTHQEHYKLYQGYVNKTNEIRRKLRDADRPKANQVFSDYRGLKVELSFALNGVKSHEVYFDILGAPEQSPSGRVADLIRRDFGSIEAWQADLKASGMAARGWVWLAYDWEDGRLYNFVGDTQNTFPIWDASPVLALDVYEHAYWLDFGSRRADYIDAFVKNIDWEAVNRRLWSLQRALRIRA